MSMLLTPKGWTTRPIPTSPKRWLPTSPAGVANTGVKAGIIGELGCSWPVTENERKVLRAGAQAQRETGAAILIHPGRNKAAPFEIIDVLAEAGADVSRVIISHLERTIAGADAYIELAQTGCCLELDLFGWETSNYAYSEMDMISDAQRMDIIQRLIEEGFLVSDSHRA